MLNFTADKMYKCAWSIYKIFFPNHTVNVSVPYGYDFNVDRIERGIENPKQYAESNKLPFILWWTPFTGDMGSVKKCSKGQCFFSQDRTLFDHHLNQVLMFYGTNINTSDLPLPRKG